MEMSDFRLLGSPHGFQTFGSKAVNVGRGITGKRHLCQDETQARVIRLKSTRNSEQILRILDANPSQGHFVRPRIEIR
ncbi:hypothetical protein AL00_07545 [Sphingobium indicum F2]|uniref:Uncharacterized protein n=1 Tax=Sphingobium indicum F2 TaxID=1450518 RepID=A0A8E0WTC3_9SPHN|nr:hypothetical protein AL00_07545 [Sphingobium indicum F2]